MYFAGNVLETCDEYTTTIVCRQKIGNNRKGSGKAGIRVGFLCTRTVDLSGFSPGWSVNAYLQGGIATGTAAWPTLPLGAGLAIFSFNVGWAHDTTQWNLTGAGMVMMVPEAETWTMMLAGLGLVGSMANARHHSSQ